MLRVFQNTVRCDSPYAVPVDRGQLGHGTGPVVNVEAAGPGPRAGHGIQHRQHHTRSGPGRESAGNDGSSRDRPWWSNFASKFPFVTMVGMGFGLGVTTAAVGFVAYRLYETRRAGRNLVRAAEERLAALARPVEVAAQGRGGRRVLAQPVEAGVGEYKPPPPPRSNARPGHDLFKSDTDAVVREQRRRGVNDELIARHQPVSSVVGLLAAKSAWGKAKGKGDTELGRDGDEGVGRYLYQEDLRLHRQWAEERFQAIEAGLERIERKLGETLEFFQGNAAQRPLHDNFGRPPRNDDDDDNDDHHYPRGPGAVIRERPAPAPPADNAGTGAPIPSANHVNLTGPLLATIHPIVNVEPEAVRNVEQRVPTPAAPAPAPPTPPPPPSTTEPVEAADLDDNRIPTVAELDSAIRALQGKYKQYTAGETDQDVTVDEVQNVMKGIGELHPEYTANKVVDTIVDPIRGDRDTPIRWGSAGFGADRATTNDNGYDPTNNDNTALPPSPTSSDSSWTTIEAPASETENHLSESEEKRLYEALLREGPNLNDRAPRGPVNSSSTPDEDESGGFDVPSGPGPSNWRGAIHLETYSETNITDAEAHREAREAQRLAVQARQRGVEGECGPFDQVVERETVPVFTLVDRLRGPVGPLGQMVRIQIHLPRVEIHDWDDLVRGDHHGLLQAEVEIRGRQGVITHVRVHDVIWFVERLGGRYVFVRRVETWM